MFRRGVSVVASMALICALFAMPAYADAAYAAETSSGSGLAGASADLLAVTTQKVKNGWSADHESYYRNGQKVTGLQKIGERRYYFNANGRLRHGDFELNGVKYFLNGDASLMGCRLGEQYYYDTLKPMTVDDAYDFDTFIWARSIVDDLTEDWDSPEDKLWKAFEWVMNQSYAIHGTFNPDDPNWMANYARYHFQGWGGDCHSDGAAFGYLAAAIGYEADVCIDAWGSSSHCWTMIGDAVYDPLFYEAKSTMYYGATSGTYETSPTARFRVPHYGSWNADPHAKTPKALLKSGYECLTKIGSNWCFFKSGKLLKNTWKKVNGKSYYFNKNGVAVKGSTKIKGVYYIFNAKGQLMNSKKAGNRIVKVAGASYRVDKKGRAVRGWAKGNKRYFFANGRMAVGTQVVNGKFYAASSKGIYNIKKTNAFRVAAKRNAPAAVLYNLLGKPKEIHYSANCEGKGYDGLWVYKNFVVTTIKPNSVAPIQKVAKQLKKGKKLPKTYEYVWMCESR